MFSFVIFSSSFYTKEELVRHKKENKENIIEGVIEEENKEITAMLIKFKSPMNIIRFPRQINENTNLHSGHAGATFKFSKLRTTGFAG